jgi:hypothetical protein
VGLVLSKIIMPRKLRLMGIAGKCIPILLIIIVLAPNAFGVFSNHSEKASGSGNLEREYYIQNGAKDIAKASVDIRNATYFDFNYSPNSEETKCKASINLTVVHAESVNCSGEAKDRNNNSTKIATKIENGSLIYRNLVMASVQGVRNSQKIANASGNSISISSTSIGNTNKSLANSITANRSERLNASQEADLINLSALAHVNSTSGPLNITSNIRIGENKLNTIADVWSGAVSIDQSIDSFGVLQESKGLTGGATFKTLIANPNGNTTSLTTMVGSGKLNRSSQHVFARHFLGLIANNSIDFEYEPYFGSTGTYDMALAQLSGESEIHSNKTRSYDILASHCEQFQSSQRIYDNGDQGLINSINTITGPLRVTTYFTQAGRLISAITNIAAGTVSVDHVVNLTNAFQSSNGEAGGDVSDTLIKNPDGTEKRAHSEVGSGNLTLSQNVSVKNANCKVDYSYHPISYETGTYDMNLNSTKCGN